jgi:hypothetical protein
MKKRIIDIHAHAFPEEIAQKAVYQIGNHYGIEMDGNGLMDELKESADNADIRHVVIL